MPYPSQIKVNNRTFPVEYVRAMKGTSSVRVKKGAVVVRVSRYVWGRKRDEMVAKFLAWAKKKLAEAGEVLEPEYRDGGRIALHNKVYEISVKQGSGERSRTVLRDGYLVDVTLPRNGGDPSRAGQVVKRFVEKVIMDDQIEYLREVIDELNDLHFRVSYERLRFKRMNSRFGSCSSKGNINIAYRLLFAPREVFRYVCVHELAHRLQMNHSKKFWALVADACPEYKEHEKWLRGSGFLLG